MRRAHREYELRFRFSAYELPTSKEFVDRRMVKPVAVWDDGERVA